MMLASALAHSYTIALPAWIDDALTDVPEVIPDREERMRLVHALAARNFREGNGGPFAALVAETDTGRIVSVGVNVVLASQVSSAHAEVTALGLAQARLGSWDLGGLNPDGSRMPRHELVVNWRPCVQCYGATLWSGVTTLVIAGSGPELEEITTFDEGPMHPHWDDEFRARGIEVVSDVLRDEALAVFRDYREAVDAQDVVVYNARGADA